MKLFRKRWVWFCLGIFPILIIVLVSAAPKEWISISYLFHRTFPDRLTPKKIYVRVHAEETRAPKWMYRLIFAKERYAKTFPGGTTLTIEAVGITDGSVTEEAARPEFGAWQVKEIAKNHITFISSVEAKTPLSFSGFNIIAPNGKNSVVQWIYDDNAGGHYTGVAEGPFPKD